MRTPTDRLATLRAARYFHWHTTLADGKLQVARLVHASSSYPQKKENKLTGWPLRQLYQWPECVARPCEPLTIAPFTASTSSPLTGSSHSLPYARCTSSATVRSSSALWKGCLHNSMAPSIKSLAVLTYSPPLVSPSSLPSVELLYSLAARP